MWFLSALAAGLALTALIVGLGMRRYGGMDGLYMRVSGEVQARRPHPEFAPTPWASPVQALKDRDPAGVAPMPAAPATGTATRAAATATRALIATSAPTKKPASGIVASAKSTPRPTRTAIPSPSPDPDPAADLPAAVRLEGLRHNWQTWNNCGPATLAMQLSYFGSRLSQADVAAVLRPYRDDKNVSPEEMASFARGQGMRVAQRVNGDADTLKRLLAAGVPVLIETWYEPKPNDGMGHYRLLVGYDDAASEWIAYDSYDGRGLKKGDPYRGIRLPYDEVARLWEVFNRTFVALYDDGRAAEVEAIVGTDAGEAEMWEAALETARAAVQVNPENAFAWFNAGSSLAALGRHDQAAWAFDQARQVGLPWRMLWYQFGPFHAYYEVGRYDEVIALANATLRNAQIEELYYWRGMAENAKGDQANAEESFRRALALNPYYAPAVAAQQEIAGPTS